MVKHTTIPERSQDAATSTKRRRTSTLYNAQQPAADIPERRVNNEYTDFPFPQRLSPLYNDFIRSTTGETYPNSTERIKTSVLCSKCEPIRTWLAENWARLLIPNQKFEHIFNHYDDSRHLKQSALSGCHLCTLFWHNFDHKMVSSQALRLARREELLSQLSNGRQVQITAYNKGSSGPVLCPYLSIPYSESFRGETTPLRSASYFQPTQIGSSSISLSSTHVSTASLAATNLAKEWIAECTTSHRKCAKAKGSSLPTRLVDVLSLSKVGKVRIVDTQSISSDSDIQYVALSYCWGPKPTFKLTKSTWEALSSGVAVETLPKTMQDAINFTQNINLGWLWIDSLCIVQDLKEDWNREALTMHQVYRDSFVTVAALGASSCDEGLFALRDPLLYSACHLFQTKQGENIYGGQDPSIEILLDAWPLHQRGWVTQERILASKTLNFGPYLIWECREKTIDEYNIIARSWCKRGFGTNGLFSDLVLSGGTYNMSSTERDEAILGIWTEIVGNYTSGILTVVADRLIAISGIIAPIQRRTGWQNLAGLWEPFLWKQLLWQKVFEPSPESRELTGLQPSWSWIAITGGVMWSGDKPTEGFFLNPIAHVKSTSNATLLPTDKNTNYNRISLQVSCMPARISTPYKLEGRVAYQATLVDFPLSGKGFYEPDLLPITRQPELFLPIGAGCWNDKDIKLSGLAVSSSTSCIGAFERVGFFTFRVNEDENRIDHSYSILHQMSTKENIILV